MTTSLLFGNIAFTQPLIQPNEATGQSRHKGYGGCVPRWAAGRHRTNLDGMLEQVTSRVQANSHERGPLRREKRKPQETIAVCQCWPVTAIPLQRIRPQTDMPLQGTPETPQAGTGPHCKPRTTTGGSKYATRRIVRFRAFDCKGLRAWRSCHPDHFGSVRHRTACDGNNVGAASQPDNPGYKHHPHRRRPGRYPQQAPDLGKECGSRKTIFLPRQDRWRAKGHDGAGKTPAL